VAQNERQQRLIERVLEDERLRGDLEDTAATALVEWASQRVATAAADPARPDAEVEAEVQAIRAAARSAARSGETEAQRVIELANAALAGSAGGAPQPSTTKPEPTGDAAQPRPEATKIVLTSPDEPETTQRILTQTVTEPSAPSASAPTQPARVVVEPSAPSASAPTQPARIVVKPNAPSTPEPAQTAAAEPQRPRISFWRRWSPFAGIRNRFRGDR
jgi:hypothetical protein